MTSIVARPLARGRSYLAATRRSSARHASTSAAAPVSPAEFYEHLLRCTPPGGWRNGIVVANSGGPDSVCLLFLLSSVLRAQKTNQSSALDTFPSSMHSIHVNHGLQPANERMESVAAAQAERLNVPHLRIKIPIPWATKLLEGATEETLRRMRTSLLYMAIGKLPTRCLAYAHHADDQVETAIMRMSSGSKEWGASGMRPIRRWGMGDARDPFRPYLRGMTAWVVRPLLEIPKDRLLATCEANNLEYVVDPTNFQPEVTIRNAIRHYLRERETVLQNSRPTKDILTVPRNRLEREFEDVIQTLCPGRSTLPDLRSAVSLLGKQVELHEVQATNILKRATLISPPSTMLLSVDKLGECTEPKTQLAIARRVMRCLSPKPWGSLAAIGHARQASFQSLVSLLWDNSRSARSMQTFTSGGEVMWQVVSLNSSGEIKFRLPEPHEPLLWLGQRAPPPADKVQFLHLDVTSRMQVALDAGQPNFVFLYDHRFAIKFYISETEYVWDGRKRWQLREMLEKGKIVIRPGDTLQLPEVVWTRDGEEDLLIGRYQDAKHSPRPEWAGVPWIHTHFVRPLTML